MDWSWVITYFPELVYGLVLTLELLMLSVVFGMLLAVPIGLVQVTGPWFLSLPARAFCTIIRGTPLLIQVWLLYYGLGSLFPMIPGSATASCGRCCARVFSTPFSPSP